MTGGRAFAQRHDACVETESQSFGEIEWSFDCGGAVLARKEANACDPCFGASGVTLLQRADAPACWALEGPVRVTGRFTLDGVPREVSAEVRLPPALSSTSAIEAALEATGVGPPAWAEVCCPVAARVAERAGSLSVPGVAGAPESIPVTMFRGPPDALPPGPVCLTPAEAYPRLTYAFAAHRFDVALIDVEGRPLPPPVQAALTERLDRAFSAAGGRKTTAAHP